MAPTPRLLTSECAAHYPRLWGLAESLSHNRSVRRYPLVLQTIAFAQMFEDWLSIVVTDMGNRLDVMPPYRVGSRPAWGANTLVAPQLDFFADNIAAYSKQDPAVAKELLIHLEMYHSAILLRTAGDETPRYLSSIKCEGCEQHSMMRTGKTYFCANVDCGFSWVKN